MADISVSASTCNHAHANVVTTAHAHQARIPHSLTSFKLMSKLQTIYLNKMNTVN